MTALVIVVGSAFCWSALHAGVLNQRANKRTRAPRRGFVEALLRGGTLERRSK